MKKIILIVTIAVGIYLFLRFLLPLVIPFVIAGIVSVIYYPFLRRIYKKSEIWESKKKKSVLVISVILFYVIVLLFIAFICGYLFRQCESIWLNFPFYEARIMSLLRDCCDYVDICLHIQGGKSYAYIEDMLANWKKINITGSLPKVTSYSVQIAGKLFGIVFEVIVTVMATFFMIQDYEMIRQYMLKSTWGRSVCRIIMKSKETLKTYLRAQGLIIALDATLCTIVFWVIRSPYFLVLGPFTAFLDALPVLGAGIFLIPCAIYMCIMGEVWKGLLLFLGYIGCVAIRQLIEPKMIGKKMELRPLFILMSMYVGVELFGVIGFLLGPLGVLIGMEIYKSQMKNNAV